MSLGEGSDIEELRNLRLVSRRFHEIASSVLFHRLVLDFRDPAPDSSKLGPDCLRCIERVVAMAAGTTRVFRNTKELRLSTYGPFSSVRDESQDNRVHPEVGQSRQLFVDSICNAISSLQMLRAFRWVHDPICEDPQLAPEVIRGLSTIATLQKLELSLLSGKLASTFSLRPISNLTVLHIEYADMASPTFISEMGPLLARCPFLATASFQGPLTFEADSVSLRDIFTEANRLKVVLPLKSLELRGVVVTADDVHAVLQQLREIEFLGISRNPSSHATTVFGEICGILKQQGTLLKSISTDVVHDDALLDFLTLNSGLQELILRPEHSLDNSSELLKRIYTNVLPSQRETLRVLKLGLYTAPKVWVALPKAEWRDEIIRCRKLRWIQSHFEYTEQLAATFAEWLEIGSRLPELEHLQLFPSIHSARTWPPWKMRMLASTSTPISQFREKNGRSFLVNGA